MIGFPRLVLLAATVWNLHSCEATVAQDGDCLSRINHHRTKYDVPHISERTDLHSCANRQSQYDSEMGAHKSYKRCGALGSQGSGGGNTCANVIDAFFNERWRCDDNMAIFGTPTATSTEPGWRACRQACLDDAECLSYDYNEDSDVCNFYDEASHTKVRTVNGAYWLGDIDSTSVQPSSVDGPNMALANVDMDAYTEPEEETVSSLEVKVDGSIGTSAVDSWTSFSLVEIDGSNTVPASGTIKQFKWYGSNSSPVQFFMYRPVGDGETFEVVGTAYAASTVDQAVNTLTVNPPIQVQKGDVMGWTWEGSAAFGFDDNSNQGLVRFTNGEDTGGPTNVGDSWVFDKGPYGRVYHVAAEFEPSQTLTTTSGINYCAAALCQGHCGPVMGGSTTTFSWGEYNNHYTLNWRPNPTLPKGGSACPSGIDTVQCWEDTDNGILWAYGVGGEDCHSTCSIAGASPDVLKCDENSPITGGFSEVASIMQHFENPYNNNDPDAFTCTKGSCWDGLASHQIRIHESNSDCYVPENTAQYSCNRSFGNANCFNQRFNQVCPCVAGCSWAAGPSCSPTSSPTTQSSTDSPTGGAEPCLENSSDKVYVKTKRNGEAVTRSCSFIGDNSARKQQLCSMTDAPQGYNLAKDACPVTCGTCAHANACTERSGDKIFFKTKNSGSVIVRKSCQTISTREGARNLACSHQVVPKGEVLAKDVCPVTCGTCDLA